MVIVSRRGRFDKAQLLKSWGKQSECSVILPSYYIGENNLTAPFDAKGTVRYGFRELLERICSDRSPCCTLVALYAKMGIHRYNLIEGTTYQLTRVEKYHFRLSIVPSPYYITLVACDPSASWPQTFQIRIDERTPAFVLTCNISRIRGGETNKYDGGQCSHPGTMPEWPTENPFENENRFYVLNHSEIKDNDWIRLYLELAVAKVKSSNKDPDLSNLEIVNVAMDTQYLNAKNATVYISYKDSCEARVGKDVDRIAMVRRTFVERTGCFNLMGKHQSLQLIPKKGANHSCEAWVGKDVKSSFDDHVSCFSPMDQNLRLEKMCKAPLSEDASCEAGVGKDVDSIGSSFNKRTRCLEKMCKGPQSEDASCEAGVGKDIDSIGSSFNELIRCLSPMDQNLSSGKMCKDPQSEDASCERTRCLSPMGKYLSSGKKCKYQHAIQGLGILGPWRFLSLRLHKSYRNHGVGLARRLHKTRSI